MNKNNIIEIVQSAQKEINSMLENSKLIKDGLIPRYKSISKNPEECSFGQWFYGEGQKLKQFSNNPMECLQNIELLHNEFHKVYHEIHQLHESSKAKGGFFGMFSKKEEIPKEYLEQLFHELENSHQKLMAELVKMERRIQATPQEKFDSLQ